MSYRRIVAAGDMKPDFDGVLEEAKNLAVELGAELHIAHVLSHTVVEDMRKDLPPDWSYDDAIINRTTAELTDRVEQVIGSAVPCSVRVAIGDPAQTIHALATAENADLIVIGIRNRSRVGKLILGSVAQEVLIDAPCPVVGVPI